MLQKKLIVVNFIAFFVFLYIDLFFNDASFVLDNYLGLHILLEAFSIFVAYAIALNGYLTYSFSQSFQRVVLGAAFFAVGTLDLLHMLSYKGMPTFIVESSVSQATWLWIIARLTEAVVLFYIILKWNTQFKIRSAKAAYFISITYVLLLGTIVTVFHSKLPVLVIDGQGVTLLKRVLEYSISLIHLSSLVVIFKNYRLTRREESLIILSALFVLSMGELVFTLYNHVYGPLNLLGHVYKVLGYFFIFRGYFVPTLNESFKKELETRDRLLETKQMLKSFFDLSLDMLSVSDLQGRFTMANKAFLETLGYRNEDLIGKHFSEFVYPEDKERSIANFNKKTAQGAPTYRFRNRYLTVDNRIKWFEWVSVPDRENNVSYAVARDITEEMEMENKLRESEEKFRRAFEDSGIGKALVGKGGELLEVNKSLCEILGYSKEELLSTNFQQLTHPEDLEDDLDLFEQLLNKKRRSYTLEKRYFHKQGHTVWALLTVSIVTDESGHPKYFISQVQDISEQKVYQETLSYIAAIVDSTDDAVLGLTPEGTIVSWNRGAERMFGYKSSEIIGKTIAELVPQERKPETEQLMNRLKNGERLKNFETVRIKADGSEVDTAITLSPILDQENQMMGVSCILKDITDKKKMEKEMLRLDRLDLVGEMAAGISHEVRNPMSTVRGFLQILSEKKECTVYSDYFNLMIEELDRANSIITEFLSIGKNKPTEVARQDLNEIISKIQPLLVADAIRQDKYVELELKEIEQLNLNEKEIRQLILNITRNGLEAMEDGGNIRIRTYMEDENVVLSISDEGKGIPHEIRDKIGTPFFTTKKNGTGLGLGVCYGIAHRNNAKIDIKTGSQGTTFYIKFKTDESSAA